MPSEVTVKDPKGALVEGATVEVVVTMVEMDHGEFKYEAKPVKKSVYQFNPKFVMCGAWNLAVKAKKGSAEAAINKNIDVKD